MEGDTMARTELEDWKRIIVDGDWAVREMWITFSDGCMKVSPNTIRHFLAWLVRNGEYVAWKWEEYIDFEDENPPRKSKSSLPKMGVDGAGLKMISKLGEKK